MATTQLSIGSPLPSFDGLVDASAAGSSLGGVRRAERAGRGGLLLHCPYVQAYEDRMIAFGREHSGRRIRLAAINAILTGHPVAQKEPHSIGCTIKGRP